MSCSSISGSSSCTIAPLKWNDCDTISKMAGFIIGKGVTNGGKFIWNVIQFFHLDDLTHLIFRLVRWPFSQGSKLLSSCARWTFDNVIYPIDRCVQPIAKFFFKTLLWDTICVNAWNWIIIPVYNAFSNISKFASSFIKSLFTNPCAKWAYRNILTPIGQLTRSIAKFFFKTLLWDFCCGKILKPIFDWTLTPLYNHIVCPFFRAIGDFFYGIFSGGFNTEAPTHQITTNNYDDYLRDQNKTLEKDFPNLHELLTSPNTFTYSVETSELEFQEAFGDNIEISQEQVHQLRNTYETEINTINNSSTHKLFSENQSVKVNNDLIVRILAYSDQSENYKNLMRSIIKLGVLPSNS